MNVPYRTMWNLYKTGTHLNSELSLQSSMFIYLPYYI